MKQTLNLQITIRHITSAIRLKLRCLGRYLRSQYVQIVTTSIAMSVLGEATANRHQAYSVALEPSSYCIKYCVKSGEATQLSESCWHIRMHIYRRLHCQIDMLQ